MISSGAAYIYILHGIVNGIYLRNVTCFGGRIFVPILISCVLFFNHSKHKPH